MKIYKLGEEVLRKKAVPVQPEDINDSLRETFNEMFQTMLDADGVGLAAPQIGDSRRYFVIISDDDVRRVFINPQIVSTSNDLCDYDEGCLSLPGFNETIKRPSKVTVQALNENGKPFTLSADGLLARIIQHEYDHLEGIVYIDRGDPNFAADVTEKMKRRLERAAKKEAEKAKKSAKIAAKLAAKEAKKNK
ncbi:peptide deformylase [Treponema ruminis]|uniref:Peptide deformylase n=1 Tax=Treponema ruminis TaxID=744515 RepID=A0A7W8GAK9_9SPIR|nr:peptide deformylase [Treponema ruminis]MBB5226827.1 peptide deformylase [Treponema ruminis]QSI01258.1 peptide deformylase [Treponema ruminis]